jgi:hypothetical protein
MKIKAVIALLCALLLGLFLAPRDGEQEKPRTQEFTVTRGTISDVLREVGELAPEDPVLLQAPFSSEIKWLVKDGTWVNKNERVLVFDEEALEAQVTQLRANVVDKRLELHLTTLSAEHAKIAELQRVENEKNDLRLAEIRHRILTSQPVGGNRLLTLDEEIKPLEKQLTDMQATLEPLEKVFRASRDIYQKALEEWQESRSRVLELQMSTDLAKTKAKRGEDKKVTASPQEPTMTLKEAKQLAQTLKAKLDEARDRRDQDRIPYEKAISAIDAIDAEAQERYIQIEIEKRGLPATRLKIDREIARLRLTESQRQAESGKRALDVGAISKSRYDQLVADAEAAAGRLEILEYRYEIAARPADEDEVAASEASLATAQRAVDNAQEIFDREMDIISSNMAMIEAQLTKAIGEMERNGKGFPAAIEGNISMLRTELEVLQEDEGARRGDILKEISALEQELEMAKTNLPHVVKAPSSGLVRLRQKDSHDARLTDIGDNWSKGHTVAMLYPPGNMRVQVGINEVNYQRVREGMTCRVSIPALDMHIPDATVAHISRIGRDREETKGRWVNSQHSGIIEFALSVDLQREVPEFRQGMTVVLEIETEQKDKVLFLPAAAVQHGTNGFSVLSKPHAATTTPIEGHYFGDNYFVVTTGLNEGDRVYRIYGDEKQ